MPQKRNPDAAELVRAKVGRIAGAFQSLLIVMKGLPLAYAKDMQEDKEVTFDALASLRLGGRGHDRHGRGPGAQRPVHAGGGRRRLLDGDRPCGLAGARASACPSARRTTSPAASLPPRRPRASPSMQLPLEAMQAISPRITADVFSVLSVENSVRSRTSYGGTAPQNVRKMARGWIKRLEKAPGKG